MVNTPIPAVVDSSLPSQESVPDAVRRLKQAAAQMQVSPLWQEIVEPRDEVFARFRPIFATAHLPEMTEAEFSPFLYFEHNHHWTGLYRQVNRICGDMPLLRKSLIALVDEGRPIADRFDEVLEALHGMGRGIITAILTVAYALRRRFVFFAIPPSLESESFATLLRGAGATQELVDTIRLRVGSLNQQIAADPDLGEGFLVGHSYFCPAAGDGAVGLDWYKTVIDTEVGPLLREYWFDKKQTDIDAIIFKLREGI
jgi:hypothetical protein